MSVKGSTVGQRNALESPGVQRRNNSLATSVWYTNAEEHDSI